MSTTATLQADWVPTETIEQGIARGLNIAPTTILSLVDSGVVGQGEGNNAQIPLPPEMTIPEGTVSELADAPLIPWAADSANVTDGTVRFGFLVSNRLQMSSKIEAVGNATATGTRMVLDRLDRDGFSIVASFANETDHTGQPLTDARFRQAMFEYDAQEPDAALGNAFIAGSVQYEDWISDVNTNGGNWTSAGAESAEIKQLGRVGSGFMTSRYGVACFKSNNTPTDGTDRLCPFMAIGRTCPIAYRNWEPVSVQVVWLPERDAWAVYTKIRYGYALIRDAEGRVLRVSNS